MPEDCECMKKWKEEVKEKLGAFDVALYNRWHHNSIIYRKIVVPRDWSGKKLPERVSKNWYIAESKDFKFCPHCGKKMIKAHWDDDSDIDTVQEVSP